LFELQRKVALTSSVKVLMGIGAAVPRAQSSTPPKPQESNHMSTFWKKFLMIVGFLGLFGLLLYSGYASKRARENERDEAVAALDRARKYPILFTDDFNANENNWPVGENADGSLEESRSIQNGVYRWEIVANEPSISWAWIDGEDISDFYLRVEARLDRSVGTWTAYFGPAFRVNPRWMEFYAFGHSEFVERKGGGDEEYFHYSYYRFVRFTDNNPEILRSDYAGSTSSNFPGLPEVRHPPDGMVNIVVVAEGSQFWCFIDGEYVTQVEDDALARGWVGLALMVPNSGEHTIVEFDRIELRAP
jgi:hypothetical protein